MKDALHDVELLQLVGVVAVLGLLVEDGLDYFGYFRADFYLVVEEFGFVVVAEFVVVEDVGEEDYLELVEMEGFGYVK
jgi:hypothetical protein